MAVEQDRVAHGDVYRLLLMQRVGKEYGPLYDTVAQIIAVVMGVAVFLVVERGVGRDGIIIYTRSVHPKCAVRPEQLDGVALTQVERVFHRLLLTGTDDDMVEIAAVTVPYDRIGGVGHTMPFAFPCAVE